MVPKLTLSIHVVEWLTTMQKLWVERESWKAFNQNSIFTPAKWGEIFLEINHSFRKFDIRLWWIASLWKLFTINAKILLCKHIFINCFSYFVNTLLHILDFHFPQWSKVKKRHRWNANFVVRLRDKFIQQVINKVFAYLVHGFVNFSNEMQRDFKFRFLGSGSAQSLRCNLMFSAHKAWNSWT